MTTLQPRSDLAAGVVLGGRYRLVGFIARGGMADVWEGHDTVLNRPIAIKILRDNLVDDAMFAERFRREAITAARLAHPSVVATFDTGTDGRTSYIVMELVRGTTLRHMLNESGALEPAMALAIASQVTGAIAHAHRGGLVHRDIKPANVLVSKDERNDDGTPVVKVTDFGIARFTQHQGGDLTTTGMVLGTPKYLSPEQIEGKEPDTRGDLYSLGVLIYEMVAGQPPFTGPTDVAMALAHLNEKPRKLSDASRARVPGSLDKLVAALLAKDPLKRPPSAWTVHRQLEQIRTELDSGRSSASRSPASRGRGKQGAQPQRPARYQRDPLRPPPAPGPQRPMVHPGAIGSGEPSAARSGWAPASDAREAHEGLSPTSGPAESLGARSPAERLGVRSRVPGVMVLALIVSSVLAGTLLLTGNGAKTVPRVASVTVFMNAQALRGGHTPDNPGETGYTIDSKPATFWETVLYGNPRFGNLYSGEGLEVRLASNTSLTELRVQSPTIGWSASSYVAARPLRTGTPLSAWGSPTSVRRNIHGGTTFSLRGRAGEAVLLWMTNLGPAKQIKISEIKVS